MPRYPGKYTPRKPIEQIYNEYRTHLTTDSYGRWPTGYKNHTEHKRIESSPRNTKAEYNNGNHFELNRLHNELKERSLSTKENNTSRLSTSEININEIAQTIKERIESLNEFAQQDTSRQLPTIELGEKTFFFDGRLWELRNIYNPSDRIDLRELEFGSREQLPLSEREQSEKQYEIQPDKTSEIKTEHDKVESSPKIETHQEITEKLAEPSYSKLDSPLLNAEITRADITPPSDITIRRKPGYDFLEAGW